MIASLTDRAGLVAKLDGFIKDITKIKDDIAKS